MSIDLPEPRRRDLPPEQARLRQWNVLMAFLCLTTSYACLHKVVIPVFLKFTALHSSPYADIDMWFLHPVTLLLSFYQERQLSAWSSALAGGGIAYGALELVQVLQGSYPGWLGISRLLSSFPFALVCIALLSGPYQGKQPSLAWAGVVSVTTLKLLMKIGNAQ